MQMREPTFEQAYQVLLLQAAGEGRGPLLFGDSLERAGEAVLPFLVGESFPDVYLEHPLLGDPFLDVTVLFGPVEPGTRIESPAAGDHAAMLDWFARARGLNDAISFGFEVDTKEERLPVSAVHFQPRVYTELVRPFCEAAGEPQAAELYLALAERMPKSWPLSFFGMFRGRPCAPLRVCGYLAPREREECAVDPDHLAAAFDTVGFSAYNDAMLSQVSALMAAAPGCVDFQFDVYPDGSIGHTFAIDVQFGVEQPKAVWASFDHGPGWGVMNLLEQWGAADSRWKASVQAAFARALPIETAVGERGLYAFSIMPQWVKARWINGLLQPAKLYHLAHSGLLDR